MDDADRVGLAREDEALRAENAALRRLVEAARLVINDGIVAVVGNIALKGDPAELEQARAVLAEATYPLDPVVDSPVLAALAAEAA